MESKLSNGRVVRSGSDWEEILARFAASGRSKAAFCRSEGLSRSTFDLWRRKVRWKQPANRSPKKSPRQPSREFVEITPVPVPAIGAWTLEIELPDGRLARLRC